MTTHVLASRRTRVWFFLVTALVVILGLQILLPRYEVTSRLFCGLGPGAVLMLFLGALVCEYVDSSLGMGYGTTLTPLLLLAGFEPLQIVPCVLMSEFVSGLAAAFMHQRDGNVDLLRDPEARSAMMMLSLLSVGGAVLAVTLTVRIPGSWLKGLIGVVILLAGFTTLATLHRRLRYRRGHLLVFGAVAAFNKGLSGGGYGPLVTSGQVVSGLAPRKAVAITSLAEALTCFVGLLAYWILHGTLDWSLALPLTTGAILSVPVATLTVRHLPEHALRTAVGIGTCLLGALTFVKLLW